MDGLMKALGLLPIVLATCCSGQMLQAIVGGGNGFSGPGSLGWLSTTSVTNNVTNLALQSQALATNTPWVPLGVTSAAPTMTNNTTDTTAPDSTQTATKMVMPAVSVGGSRSFTYQQFTLTTPQPYTASIYAKGAAGGEVFWLAVSVGSSWYRVKITATTSWQRYQFTWVTTNSATNYVFVGTDLTDAGESATSAQTVYLWGAQVVVGQYAGTYIATTTVAVTQSQTTTLPAGIAFRDFSTLTSYAGNPIVTYNTGSYNTQGTSLPRIKPNGISGGTYYAVTSGNSGGTGYGWHNLNLYSGPDPLHWTDVSASNPVIAGTASTWNDNYLLHWSLSPACSIDTYCAYYSAETSGHAPSIGLAHSADLQNWTNYASNPVINDSTEGHGQVSKIMIPSVIQIGSTLYMYTSAGCNSYCANFFVYWTSPASDGKAWTYGGVAFSPPGSGDWNTGDNVLDPEVFQNNHGFYEMVYVTQTGGGSGQSIGYAISKDGINFYNYQPAAIIAPGGSAYPGANPFVGDPLMFPLNGTMYVLFDESSLSNSWGWAATMTDH